MIVRILFWRLGESGAQLDDLRKLATELDPLGEPSTWLTNDASESFGAIIYTEPDEDEGLPEQIASLRAFVGREPDLYEEYDAFS